VASTLLHLHLHLHLHPPLPHPDADMFCEAPPAPKMMSFSSGRARVELCFT
jgi:hypothetical protein